MTAPGARADTGVYGPQFPDHHDLYLAQNAPLEADRAGCSDVVYDRLVLERQQTELAFLEGCDRDLIRSLEAEPDAGAAPEPEPEIEP